MNETLTTQPNNKPYSIRGDERFKVLNKLYGFNKGLRIAEQTLRFKPYFSQNHDARMNVTRFVQELCNGEFYAREDLSADEAALILRDSSVDSILRKYADKADRFAKEKPIRVGRNNIVQILTFEIPRLQEGFMELDKNPYGAGRVIRNPTDDYWNGSWDNAVRRVELR